MKNFLITSCLIILFLPILTFAQGYEPLVGIPGVNPNASGGFDTYINTLYALSISIAALLAVIKIIIAGVKWMMTDIVTTKGEAKKDIQGALIGLLIVLAAVLILTVINPNLAKVDLQLNTVQTQKYTAITTSFSAAPIVSRTGYDAVAVTSGVGGETIEVFQDDCTDSGGHYQVVGGMEYRCYAKQPNQTVYVHPVCNAEDLNNGELCNEKKAIAENNCSGSLTVDVERINGTLYGACVR